MQRQGVNLFYEIASSSHHKFNGYSYYEISLSLLMCLYFSVKYSKLLESLLLRDNFFLQNWKIFCLLKFESNGKCHLQCKIKKAIFCDMLISFSLRLSVKPRYQSHLHKNQRLRASRSFKNQTIVSKKTFHSWEWELFSAGHIRPFFLPRKPNSSLKC